MGVWQGSVRTGTVIVSCCTPLTSHSRQTCTSLASTATQTMGVWQGCSGWQSDRYSVSLHWTNWPIDLDDNKSSQIELWKNSVRLAGVDNSSWKPTWSVFIYRWSQRSTPIRRLLPRRPPWQSTHHENSRRSTNCVSFDRSVHRSLKLSAQLWSIPSRHQQAGLVQQSTCWTRRRPDRPTTVRDPRGSLPCFSEEKVWDFPLDSPLDTFGLALVLFFEYRICQFFSSSYSCHFFPTDKHHQTLKKWLLRFAHVNSYFNFNFYSAHSHS